MDRFPYQSRPSPEFGLLHTILLRLQIKGKSSIEPYLFLFDTGADVSSLPFSAAKKLGIELQKCPQLQMKGFEGTTITVYRSKINILIGRKFYPIPCVFHPNEDVATLLGRAGIINKFTITLNAKKKVAEFKSI